MSAAADTADSADPASAGLLGLVLGCGATAALLVPSPLPRFRLPE